jgi:hypothetical protein
MLLAGWALEQVAASTMGAALPESVVVQVPLLSVVFSIERWSWTSAEAIDWKMSRMRNWGERIAIDGETPLDCKSLLNNVGRWFVRSADNPETIVPARRISRPQE